MLRRILIGAVLFSLMIIAAACSGPTSTPTPTPNPNPTPTPKPSGPIKATWINSQVDGDIVSISVHEVENNWNIHFELEIDGDDLAFMAYLLDGEIYVRANVCPPCQSVGFSLKEDILVCDRCATTFDAKTGDGIKGACVDFPKASVPYEINDGNIVMKTTDLIAAYQNTIKPGLP